MALCVWGTLHLFGGPSVFVDLWPCDAIALAIALPAWRQSQNRLRLALASAGGYMLATLLIGMPLWASAWLAAVCALQLWVTCYILSFSIASFEDLKSVWNSVRLIIVIIIVTAGGAELTVLPIAGQHGAPLIEAWLRIMQGDMLGLLAIFPAALFFSSGALRAFRRIRQRIRLATFWTIFLAGTCFGVFRQSHLPLLFLVFPPLIGLVFALGTEGAAFAVLIVTVVGGWLTELGYGPIMLITSAPRDVSVLVFQVFIIAAVVVSLPVGALLDERRRAERAEKEAQSIYTTLLKHAEDIVILASFSNQRRFVSPSVMKACGWTEAEFFRHGQHGPIHSKDQEIVDAMQARIQAGEERVTARYRMLRKDGTYRWVEATATGYRRLNKGRMEGYVATVRDISVQMEAELAWNAERAVMARENSKLVDLAWKDELTDLANRRSFNQLLGIEIARKVRNDAPLSLLALDVDYFKKYNDILGHPAGDRCLQTVAQVLRSAASRVTDVPARVGGEEFAIILPNTSVDGATQVGARIRDMIAQQEIQHPGAPLQRLTVSIGAATIPAGYEASAEELIQAADLALYESKQSGRDRQTVCPTVGRRRENPESVTAHINA